MAGPDLTNTRLEHTEERRTKMAKETTHRDPPRRAARIERRAKKRVETAMRKKLVKMMKSAASGSNR